MVKIKKKSSTSISFQKMTTFGTKHILNLTQKNFLDFSPFCQRALQKNSCQTIRRALKSHGKKMGEDQYSSSECPLGKTLAIFGFSLFSRKKSRLGCKKQQYINGKNCDFFVQKYCWSCELYQKKYHSALILSFQKCKKQHLNKKEKRNLKISLSFFYLFIFHSTINLVRQRTIYTRKLPKNLYIIIHVCILPFVKFFFVFFSRRKILSSDFFVDN